MKLKLLIRTEKTSLVFDWGHAYCSIGRKDCDLTLPDVRCSLQHAILYEGFDGSLQIKDLQSTNGTFVNGKKMRETTLHVGDEVKLGRTYLVVLDYTKAALTKTIADSSRKRSDRKKEIEQSLTTTIQEKGAVSSWPEHLLCLPPDVQKQFVDYIDERGAKVSLPVKDMFQKK